MLERACATRLACALVSVASALDCRVSVPRFTKLVRATAAHADMLVAPILRFARPARSVPRRTDIPASDTFRPIGDQQAVEVKNEELYLEVQLDDPAAAA